MTSRRVWLGTMVVVSVMSGCTPSVTERSSSSGTTRSSSRGEDGTASESETSLDGGVHWPQRDPVPSAPEAEPDAGSLDVCGDALLSAGEACDDGNHAPGDGCDASCALESGWVCPVVGARCRAAQCSDGIVAGDEECEDGNDVPLDGCDERCRVEAGFACGAIGESCHATLCGDGRTEGSEQCDDGADDVPFDGCFACKKEPHCADGGCEAVCGDGIKFPSEACDDANMRDADGCSASCALEDGFSCKSEQAEPAAFVDLPIVYRDFRGSDLPELSAAGLAAGHVDFQNESGSETGLVMGSLSADKKPVYALADGVSATTSSAQMFDEWYRDDPAYNRTIVDTVRLTRNERGDYVFFDPSFFPLDGRGFVAEGNEPLRAGAADELGVTQHNFSFTSELRTWFEYQGGEFLEFKGDDDVWVFVNGRLAVDLGGVHASETGSVTLDASGTDGRFAITRGNIYEIAVFQAERNTTNSQYQLTLRDFVQARTSCAPICGDGVLTPDEACDDQKLDGSYGGCAPGCVFGPRCGDGVLQAEHGEQCDDQNRNDTDDCTNACESNVVL